MTQQLYFTDDNGETYPVNLGEIVCLVKRIEALEDHAKRVANKIEETVLEMEVSGAYKSAFARMVTYLRDGP